MLGTLTWSHTVELTRSKQALDGFVLSLPLV